MVADDDGVRELDYEADVLSRIDWRGFDPEHIAAGIPENAQAADAQLRRIGLTEGGDVSETIAGTSEVAAFDPVHAVRMTLDIVPNPFLGREIVGRLLDVLRGRGFDDRKLGGIARLVVEELRKELDGERDKRAEAQFKEGVEGGQIQFRLRLDGRDWQMPSQLDASEPPGSYQFLTQSGGSLQRSLFEPVYRSELNQDEQDVAVYLDGDAAVTWWHRNVARTQYGNPRLEETEDLPRFYLRGSGRRCRGPDCRPRDQGRSLGQFGHRLQARSARLPVRQLHLGRQHTRRTAGVGRGRRSNRGVCAHPPE